MACKGAKNARTQLEVVKSELLPQVAPPVKADAIPEKLYFGVDSATQSNDILQNNLTEFEWVDRNKMYPNFWGRNIVGHNALTKQEIDFLHDKGCKIAAMCRCLSETQTDKQGEDFATKIDIIAFDLGIPEGSAIFLEIEESQYVTRNFMRGYAKTLLEMGYTPAFKANTDAVHEFDREFSRGLQTDRYIFEKCIIWAVAPSLAEFDRVTTTHFIHPDNWKPFAPSGITRNDIAIWQYGKNCHPINDDAGNETTFNVNLVRDKQIIIDKMF